MTGEPTFAALDLQDDRHQARVVRRAAVFDAIAVRLAKLRQIRDANVLLDRVCPDAAESCGFSRTMMSRVDEPDWLPWMVHFESNPGFDREFPRYLRGTRIAFAESTPEITALRERRPATTHDGATQHGLPALLAGKTASYVVVPLIAAGRVIGLLHADHGIGGHPPDAVDGDALWMFAEGFALMYERAVLAERLRAQSDRLREALEAAATLSEAITGSEMRLMPGTDTDGPSVASSAEMADDDGVHPLLTDREREVAFLMAQGLTNSGIAERLVISRETVKSHVRHVLRKLGAANRSEAIARYLGHAPRD